MSIDIEQKKDEELVAMTLHDQDFFVYLVERYESKLSRYIKRISGFSSDDIQDVLQEVFIKVYRNLNGFDKGLKFSSWIYRITHNEVINHFRKNKAHQEKVVWTGADEEDIVDLIASDEDLNKIINTRINNEIILEVLEKLRYEYKEVLVLKFMQELDYQEISDILKKPMGTIATLINRAKKQFKDEFKKKNINLN